MKKLRWPVVWRAAVSVIILALPLGLLQQWLVDSGRIDKGDAVNLVLYFAILFTGVLGGFAAGRLAPDAGLQNGAAASGLATLAIEVGGAIRRTIVGASISSPIAWLYLALLMATCAMLGAAFERRSRGLRPGGPDPKG